MPDLGKYAVYVLSAYGVSITCLVALVWVSFAQAARAKVQLKAVEDRVKRG